MWPKGAAQIGNITSSNATVKAPIYGMEIPWSDTDEREFCCNRWFVVTLSTTETGTLIAHVNITQSPDVKFDSSGNSSTTNFLCLTQSNATANRVAFSQSRAETGNVTNNWTLYGGYALINNGSANLFARSAGIDGLYDLFWSTSSLPNDYTPLTVRAFSQ